MTDFTFTLVKLTITEYRSLAGYVLEPDGSFFECTVQDARQARDICDFITDLLYAPCPPEGSVELDTPQGRLILTGRDGQRSAQGDFSWPEQLSWGMALTGLEEGVFREVLGTFVIEGVPETVSPALRDHCLKPFGGLANLIYNVEKLEDKKNGFSNSAQTGKTDRLLQRRQELCERIGTQDQMESQIAQLEEELQSYNDRMDDNAKRAVILKADMKNYTDDIKLVENKENAAHLKNEIQFNEKKLRILRYEAQREAPLPPPGELRDLRQTYSDYSRISAQLCDAQNQLMSAADNLDYHNNIFSHATFDAEGVKQEYDRIHANRKGRTVFLAATALMTLVAFVTFVGLAAFSDSSLLFCALVGTSLFCFGLMCFVASTMFSKQTQTILQRLNIQTKKEFDELHDKLKAHEKTGNVYRERLEKCKKQCQLYTKLSDDYLQKLKNLLAYTQKTFETNAQISHLCDRILLNCDAIYELEQQLKNQKQTYERMLSADVEKEDLTISREFSALERELDFVQRQTASLLAKKTEAEASLQKLKEQKERLESDKAELSALERELETLSGEYNAICALQKPHLKEVAALKGQVEAQLCQQADLLLRNIRKPNEHFALSDRLLPVILCQGKTVAGENDSSYIGRAAMLVFKVLICTEYLKKCPLFFFDGFSFVDQKTAKEILNKLLTTQHQLLALNSPHSSCLKEWLL